MNITIIFQLEREKIISFTPEIEVRQIVKTSGIELTIEDNECDGWYNSWQEMKIKNRKKAKSNSDEENSCVGLPPTKKK